MKLGIDLGGTKIECVVLDDQHQIIHQARTATPKGDYQATLAAICALIDDTKLIAPSHLPVGIGIPGTLASDTGVIKNANSTCLIGHALDKDLETELNRSVRLANDANCFIWSEFCDGAAKDYDNAFGVIIGTGVGGGLVINQCLVNGLNGIAGEWGHNPLPRFELENRDCYCGKHDCIETYLSGPAFAQRYLEKQAVFSNKSFSNTPLSNTSNEHTQLNAQSIVSQARQGNQNAQHHLEDYAKRLAAGLTSIINTVDPDVIVLGGGMSNIDELYELVPHYLKSFVFSDTIHTQIVPAVHGDSSGVRGAAWLWDH